MNNNNTSGNRSFGSLDMNVKLEGTVIANCFWILKQKEKIKELKFEKVQLKIENRILDRDKAELEEKYKDSSNTLQNALQKIREQQKTIEELEQKLNVFNLQSNKSKESTQNNKNNVATTGTRFSLLGKIKSLKGDLKLCKAVECSYKGDNKNQQIK